MFASKDLFFTNKSGGYQISRSVRLRSSASANLTRTPATTTNQKTYTWSGWVKRGTLGTANYFFNASYGNNSRYNYSRFDAGDTITVNGGLYSTGASTTVSFNLTTTQVFRDPSAWYHIVLAVDTTQATSSNRVKLYINGSQVTAFSSATYSALNDNTYVNASTTPMIMGYDSLQSAGFDGYLTEVNFIDGQALTPSSFGQTNSVTGVWQPIKYTGTYGTNGFYLNFSDNSAATAAAIGKDYSGNGNNWTPNNISVTAGVTYDSMTDVPTLYADGGNGRGNYCTANPVNNSATLADGNLQISNGIGSGKNFVGTIGVSSGKWYWEILCTGGTSNTYELGVLGGSFGSNYLTTTPDSVTGSYVYYGNTGNKYVSTVGSAYGSTFTTNDVIGFALDMDAGTLVCYKNNVSQGTLASGLSGTFFPYGGNGNPATSGQFALNFGQRPFTYTPPTGFVALNTQNLPTPTISNGANYMAATTYTGTGSTLTISNSTNNPAGITFQPDFVWVKGRSGATDHALYDSVRGTTKDLASNTTAAETTQATGLTAFGSTGFTVGALAKMNTNTATYVGWQWLAGAGSSSSNTSGSITSTVSVNATAGFSVVTYTGTGANATVGHGLGVAPKMVIVKLRSGIQDWIVWQTALAGTEYLLLDTTAAKATGATFWNSTTPTSTVFSIGSSGATNTSSGTYVAYCWSEVAGYSKFGSYTGNGSADGPFVFTGFRPRWVMIKLTSAAGGNWIMVDTSRDTYNLSTNKLGANVADAENGVNVGNSTQNTLDILSNGFKLRATQTDTNGNGNSYIYVAFAENPTKLALAR